MIVGIADVHIGNHRLFGGRALGGVNDRATDTLDALHRSVADLRLSDHLIVAGDLFDSDTPPPALVARTMQALKGRHKTYILNGNHDMTSEADGHSAIAPLYTVGHLIYKTSYFGDRYMIALPHHVGPAREWLPKQLAQLRWMTKGSPRLLVCHLGLEHEDTPPWLRGADDSIHVAQLAALCIEYGITHVWAGNWHAAWQGRVNGVHMRQIGALVPTGFDNPGDTPYGRVVRWDGEFKADIVIPGPRFLKFTDLCALQDWSPLNDANTYYIHAQVPEHAWWETKTYLDGLKSDGEIKDYKISRQPEETRARAKQAAQSAADASTLGEALQQYVAAADLGDADPERVHQLCRAYLQVGD